jgi:hypothetical protein
MRTPIPMVYMLNMLYNHYNNIQNIYSKSYNKNDKIIKYNYKPL